MKLTKAKNRNIEALEDLLQRFPKRPCVLCGKKDRAPIYLNSQGKLCPDCLDDLVQLMRGFNPAEIHDRSAPDRKRGPLKALPRGKR